MTRRLRVRTVLVAGALLLHPPAVRALDPGRAITQYASDSWDTERGLPQNSVQAILQAQDGALWMGTQEGVVRFDGARFVVFEAATTPALRTNEVAALAEGPPGTLWVGTTGGGVARHEGGVWTEIPAAAGLDADLVSALLVEGRTVWVGTRAGLQQGEGGRRRPVAGVTTAVSALEPRRAGGFWMATADGIRVVHGGKVEPGPAPPDGARVLALHEDRAGRLWVGTETHGLWRTAADGTASRVADTGDGPFLALREDSDGNLWAGTEEHLLRVAADGTVATRPSDGNFSSAVVALLEDREGGLWLGTTGNGVTRLRDAPFTTFGRPEGLPDVVLSVMESRDGALWAGTDGGGLCTRAGTAVRCLTKADGLAGNAVAALYEAKDGAFWIGTTTGISRLPRAAIVPASDVRTFTGANGLGGEFVRAIMETADGTLWAGTNRGLRRRDGNVFRSVDAAGLLPDPSVNGLLADPTGSLWVATDGGLARVENGAVTQAWKGGDGVPRAPLSAIVRDADGTLWITSSGGGLVRMRNGRFAAATTRHGFPSDAPHAVVEDGQGTFWLSSNKGVFTVPRPDLESVLDGHATRVTPTVYGTADGLRNAECNGGVQPALWRDTRGRLWFPTVRGAAVVDPAHLTHESVPPPVAVESVLADGRALRMTTPVVVRPGFGHRLEIPFSAYTFAHPARVQFHYRLSGVDDDWVDAGTRRTAYYTNLGPGTYEFQVRARNGDGVWSRHASRSRSCRW